MVVKDDWVRAAIAEDTMVAELLVRLKDARASAPIQIVAVSERAETVLPPPRWGIRQPRSRLAFRCDTASPVKAGDSRRNSPTTPLSWSAGTASSSGTADCYEDSDLPACGSSRSKAFAVNDSTGLLSKKLKRKKTFVELEEESLLLKEEIHLNKELATLNAAFNDERSSNENLKRMKHDFNTHTLPSGARAPDEHIHKGTCSANSHINTYSLNDGSSVMPPQVSNAFSEPDAVDKQETSFMLPDLNLMPSEDELCL